MNLVDSSISLPSFTIISFKRLVNNGACSATLSFTSGKMSIFAIEEAVPRSFVASN